MKKINYLIGLFLIGSAVLFSSCGKDSEPTPDAAPDAPVATSTITTANGGNSGTANTTLKVTTATGTAKIRLEVTSTSDLDRIYIMKSEDNGAFSPLSFSGNITNAASQTFTGGSTDYTFKIPSGSSARSFTLDIPVTVRTSTAAVTDVYKIWITNGAGAFEKPTKNVVLGQAVVTLQYTAVATTTFASGTVDLGDQSYNGIGSLLVTSGQVSALLTADYNEAPESSDLALCALNSAGDEKENLSGNLYLVSPDQRIVLKYPAVNEPANANTTSISAYSGSFEDATGATLTALTPSGNKVKIASGGVYQFQTEKGKKGLVKVNSITGAAGTAQKINVSVKVLN